MSLLDELINVQLVVIDDDLRLAFCWFGGHAINVYAEDGTEVDYVTIDTVKRPTPQQVRAAIARIRKHYREVSDDEG